MRNVSGKSCRENQNTHFMFNVFLFSKIVRECDNVEKCCTARQATFNNIIRRRKDAIFLLAKAVHTHARAHSCMHAYDI